MQTELGRLLVARDGRGISRIHFLDSAKPRPAIDGWQQTGGDPLLNEAALLTARNNLKQITNETLDEAIDHISRYGSLHTEAIVTRDYANAQRFIREVGSSTVIVNASTRFADGGELGLGAEIGISTTKLHSFGPMGLEDLTTRKFIVYGDGQVRG
jgi:hypothetical protein